MSLDLLTIRENLIIFSYVYRRMFGSRFGQNDAQRFLPVQCSGHPDTYIPILGLQQMYIFKLLNTSHMWLPTHSSWAQGNGIRSENRMLFPTIRLSYSILESILQFTSSAEYDRNNVPMWQLFDADSPFRKVELSVTKFVERCEQHPSINTERSHFRKKNIDFRAG